MIERSEYGTPQRRLSLKVLAWMFAILAATQLVSFGVCMPLQDAPAPPAKPYRERLLDRALKGDAEAQFELAKNYETGRIGLPQDIAQAQHWYREAANQGDPFAEASLGILFNFGKGVEKDYVQAYFWYERAMSHLSGGDRESVAEMLDAVVSKMSSGELLKAKRMSKDPKATPKPSN